MIKTNPCRLCGVRNGHLPICPYFTLILLLIGCSGPSFTAKVEFNDSLKHDSGNVGIHGGTSGIDSGIIEKDSAGITRIIELSEASMGGIGGRSTSIGMGGKTEETGGASQTPDSGLPVDPCADCKVGTFNEQPCCKLLPEAHCGVIFKGDHTSCIDWR